MTITIKLYSVSMMFCQDGARLLKASAESFVPSVLPPCGRVLLRRRRHLVAVVGNSFFFHRVVAAVLLYSLPINHESMGMLRRNF